MHWAEKWVGREYRPGEWDCADMVREVVMERTGIDVPLPSDREWRGMLPSTLQAFGETVVEETRQPEDGDCVLMKIKGHKRSLGSHVGIFAWVNGQAWVLHALAERGVVFCPVDQIGRMALDVVGYYSMALALVPSAPKLVKIDNWPHPVTSEGRVAVVGSQAKHSRRSSTPSFPSEWARWRSSMGGLYLGSCGGKFTSA